MGVTLGCTEGRISTKGKTHKDKQQKAIAAKWCLKCEGVSIMSPSAWNAGLLHHQDSDVLNDMASAG